MTAPTRAPSPRWFSTAVRVLVLVFLVLLGLRLVNVNPLGDLWGRLWGDGGSGPEAVQSEIERLEELTEFHAARGTFPVIVDLAGQGEDEGLIPRLVPGFLDANLTIARVPTRVDMVVDLSRAELSEERRDDRRVLVARVPALQYSEPEFGEVEILAEQRGVLTRIGDAVGGRTEDAAVFNEMRTAAGEQALLQARESDLRGLGEQSVQDFLTSLATGLDFDEVDVRFDTAPQ